jgi:hypothetical protein
MIKRMLLEELKQWIDTLTEFKEKGLTLEDVIKILKEDLVEPK